MNNIFEYQRTTNKVITEEDLGLLQNKNYTNGDPIKVGDQVLYVFLEGEPYDDPELPNGQLVPLELVTLNIDQIDQYEFKKGTEHLQLPVLKLKK